ncbi:MAG: DUF4332 domain-containing protein [Candidatus Lokiarchaeota archaeon]|nr:DUF4332 domain-containing protein [Candidatus Lokiarchaeota archaeon]
MVEDESDDFVAELKDVIKGRYYTYARERYNEWSDKESKLGLKLKKEIYEGIIKDSKEFIEHKFKHLKAYVKDRNYTRLDLEMKIIKKNLNYLHDIIAELNTDDQINWDKLQVEFRIFAKNTAQALMKYENDYRKLIEDENKNFEKMKEKLEKGKDKEKIAAIEQKKVQLILETREGNYHDKFIEYIPFFGVSTIRLRVIINEPVKDLWIRPHFTPDLYSTNVAWSNYVCGLNNEHTDFNITHGFIATYGGGNLGGFKIGEVPEHTEKYVFFFLRHHDEKLKDLLDFSITFDAVEEDGWGQKVMDSLTIQLKYPDDIRPETLKEIPDLADPKCPCYPIYSYDYKDFKGRPDEKYREINFRGNMLPGYYPRWIPPQKIEYEPISEKLKERISNLKVRTYPNGEVRIWYYFGTEPRLIAHLKGSLSDAVFYDPLKMVTADIMRFYSEDIIVIRIWFWWIDLRMNDKKWRMFHEMPDFERVDFVIDLNNPQKNKNIIPFISTDVHWKEFWLDTRYVDKVVDVKFTPIGIDLVNWKQLVAYFSHHLGILYNPLPAIIYSLFTGLQDDKDFYCVICGKKTSEPPNVAAIKQIAEEIDEKNLTEKEYAKMAEKIIADDMTDLMCPSCKKIIRKDDKLQYLFLFKDFEKLHKKLSDEILKDALKEETKEAGVKHALRIQNCHVPTPADGITSHEWCSSTVVKPLPLKELETREEFENSLKLNKLDHYDITNLEGMKSSYAVKLYKLGINKLRELVNADINQVYESIERTGLSQKEVEELYDLLSRWQHMAELYQIKGIGSQMSDLLVEVGENIRSLADRNPEELLVDIKRYNSIHNDVSRVPSIEKLKDWIEQAKTLL